MLTRRIDAGKSGVVGWLKMAIYQSYARIVGRSDGSRAVVSARCIVRCPLLSGFAADNLKGSSVIASTTIASLENSWARDRFRLTRSDIRGATVAQVSEAAGNDAVETMQNSDRGKAHRLRETFAVLSIMPQRTVERVRAAYAAVAEAKSSAYRDHDYESEW